MATLERTGSRKVKDLAAGGEVDHIFVYGTLRSRTKTAERHLLAKYGTRIGTGQVRYASLFLGDYPYAVPNERAGSVLFGEVYRLDPSTRIEVLRKLDEYEEYNPLDVKGSLYRREVVQVLIGSENIRAWIYWYNRPIKNSPLLRHGNFLRTQMHVVPKGRGWQLKISGIDKAEGIISTKVEALKKARKLAGKNRMTLVIHGRDGRIQERIVADE